MQAKRKALFGFLNFKAFNVKLMDFALWISIALTHFNVFSPMSCIADITGSNS